jgi:hypothetical protein
MSGKQAKATRRAAPTVTASRSGVPLITFSRAMDTIFAPWFSGPSWATWRVIAKAEDAEPLTPAEAQVFAQVSGGRMPTTAPVRERWTFGGRRGAKSLVAAARAVHAATCVDYSPYLKPGERAVVMVIASDRDQAAVTFRYVEGFFDNIDMLGALVTRRTADSIELSNGVTLQVATASFRRIRGRTVCFAVLEELCFWFDDAESKNPASEVIAALRPAMATIPNARLVVISSPYRRAGIAWETYRRYYGTSDADVLVLQASTLMLNPTIDRKFLDAEYEKDPAAFSNEYDANFRTDLESFVSPGAVERVAVQGRTYLPYDPGRYVAFCDPAGGSGQDSMTLAIARREGNKAVLCRVVEWRPNFDPDEVAREASEILKEYGVTRVTGDHFAGDWPRSRFKAHQVEYVKAKLTKSDYYAAFLPLVNGQRVELLDNKRLLAQLLALERSTSRLGKDSISHPPNGHDDVINAAAGACVLAVSAQQAFADWAPKPAPPTASGVREEVRRVNGVNVVYRIFPDGRAVLDRVADDARQQINGHVYAKCSRCGEQHPVPKEGDPAEPWCPRVWRPEDLMRRGEMWGS